MKGSPAATLLALPLVERSRLKSSHIPRRFELIYYDRSIFWRSRPLSAFMALTSTLCLVIR
jgi:hypothetical protein